MSRVKRHTTKRPPQEDLSKESARLTQDISYLEDALALHRRNVDHDRSSLSGIIRQEVGGSRWQYGGGGKLHTFRSKNDLEEVQGAEGRGRPGHSARPATSSKKPENNSPLEVVAAYQAPGPRCLNEDTTTHSKATAKPATSSKGKPSSKPSLKRSTKSSRQEQTTWAFGIGPDKIKPNSKEYDAVMTNLFGKGGFPLEKNYSVQSATVGMSLFSEKDNTDLNEMKSKVLKRASAVLIMRPRPAPTVGSKNSTHSLYSRWQKTLPDARPNHAPKVKAKEQKKRGRGEKGAVAEGRKERMNNSAAGLDLRVEQPPPTPTKYPQASVSNEPKLGVQGHIQHQAQDHTQNHSENDAEVQNSSSEEKSDKGYSLHSDLTLEAACGGEEVNDENNPNDVLALFGSGLDPDRKTQPACAVTASWHRVPNSAWDRMAVPKPWDKWGQLDRFSQDNKNSDREPHPAEPGCHRISSKSTKSAELKSSAKVHKRPSTGQSWNHNWHQTSEKHEKWPKSAEYCHSWTGATFSEDLEKTVQQQQQILPPSKHQAISEWLDKHVGQSSEDYDKPQSVSSFEEEEGSSSEKDSFKVAEVESVASWLGTLGLRDLKSCQRLFIEHDIEVIDLPSLTVPVLQSMGVTKLGTLMKIMRGVENLVNTQTNQASTRKSRKEKTGRSWEGWHEAVEVTSEENGDSVTPVSADQEQKKESESQRQEVEGQKNSRDMMTEEKKTVSAKERVESLRSSLQELYRQLSVDRPPSKDSAIPANSGETSPFECSHFQPEAGCSEFFISNHSMHQTSESDVSIVRVDENARPGLRDSHVKGSDPDVMPSQHDSAKLTGWSTSDENLDTQGPPVSRKAPLPRTSDKPLPPDATTVSQGGRKPAKTKSNESITKPKVKTKLHAPVDKVKGLGDATQQRLTAGKIDAGVAHLAQRLANRQKKREKEEELMEQRLQKLRQQRNAMAARHRLRERSRSVERECSPLGTVTVGNGNVQNSRRKSDGSLDETATFRFHSAADILTDLVNHDIAHQGQGHMRTSLASDLLTTQMQEMADLLQHPPENQAGVHGETLNAVRNLQHKLHTLERSLLQTTPATRHSLNPASISAAAGAASHETAMLPSGSHGDFACNLNHLGSPGAIGASGVKDVEGVMMNDGHDQSEPDCIPGLQRLPQLSPQEEDEAEVRWPHSLSRHAGNISQTSPAQGKSWRPPQSSGTWQRNWNRNASSAMNRNASSDMNRNASSDMNSNATTDGADPGKECGAQRIDLSLQGVTVGKEVSEAQTASHRKIGGEWLASKVQSSAAHLSLSKRQLLNEIWKEKDEHRKNVRQLKSELTRLQHKDPVSKWELDATDIEFKETDLIGEGAFSKVFRGKFQGAEVAVKQLNSPLSSQDKTYFAAEVSLLRDLRHPRVVLLVGVSSAQRLPVMVLEFMAGGDLYTCIHDASRPSLDHAQFYQIARDMSSGMVYLHHHHPPVLHLDLKSMNVLLTSTHRAKIADFGFSKLKHDADRLASRPARNREVKGSPAWMAPELLQGGDVSPKADVFSFGVILWEMVTRKHPYRGCSVYQILEQVRTDKRPAIPEGCPPDLSMLITKCWTQNPAARPNFKEILKKTESLSFPPGWRAAETQATHSAQQIISLETTTQELSPILAAAAEVESKAAKTLPPASDSQSKNINSKAGKGQQNVTKGKTTGGRTPRVRNSLETCDYNLSEEDTLCLEDSLDEPTATTLHNDSLEDASAVSPGSEDSLEDHSRIPKFSLHEGKMESSGTEKKPAVSSHSRTSDVPSLPLDGLRTPTPPPVSTSTSTLYDSVEEDCDRTIPSHPLPASSPGVGSHAGSGSVSGTGPSSGYDSCPSPSLRSSVPRRNLTPIVPRLSLGDIGDDVKKVVSQPQCGVSTCVTQTEPLTPSTEARAESSRTKSTTYVKRANSEVAQPGGSSSARSNVPVESGRMSARQARRLGQSRRSLSARDQPLSSSPRNSSSKVSSKESSSLVVALSKDVEKSHRAPLNGYGDGHSNPSVATAKKQEVTERSKDGAFTPTPKERTKLQGVASSSGCKNAVHKSRVESPRRTHKEGRVGNLRETSGETDEERNEETVRWEVEDVRREGSKEIIQDASEMIIEEVGDEDEGQETVRELGEDKTGTAERALAKSTSSRNCSKSDSAGDCDSPLTPTPSPPAHPSAQREAVRTSSSQHPQNRTFSPPLTQTPPPPPPPPPPLPPPLTFTQAIPRLSQSSVVSQDNGKQRSATLASVHQELLQRASASKSVERRSGAGKKKRNFLKERYRGNPHISVEASALLEQKGQLKSVTLPHPNQLKDAHDDGRELGVSMAGLLRKAIGDRRFAMGENAASSNSQDVSWSLQDD